MKQHFRTALCAYPLLAFFSPENFVMSLTPDYVDSFLKLPPASLSLHVRCLHTFPVGRTHGIAHSPFQRNISAHVK
jgi:hypothetical protein